MRGIAPTVAGVDFSNIAISLTGSVANTGIAGQSASSGIVVPGGLVRASSATNGREVIYDPYSVAFSDSASLVRGNHLTKIGGDVRMIRMTTDQLGGITYSYSNVTNFLSNTPAQIQYLGDISAPSVFNNGAAGLRHTSQQYYTVFAQDEWHATTNLTLNYGLRYEYYTPLKERDDLIVKFNIETGQIEPNTTPLHGSKKDSIQPRLSATYALGSRTVLRGGYGMFVGPGQGEDLIQPIESDRVSTTLSSGPFLAYPINQDLLVANFVNNPNNRSYQPRAYAQEYAIPEKVHQYTASVQQELGSGFATTVGYVGSQGRNLFLRSVANNIVDVVTNPNPANAAFVIREFSIVNRDANGNVTGVQNPYAEVDFKTSGGKDSYNALMLSLNRRSTNGIATNMQYTFATSRGTSGGSNEANTAANNARTLEQFDYEDGYNNFDVRHTFNISLLYSLPFGRGRKFGNNASALTQAALGGWEVGGIYNARSGVPINVLVTRPDILYRDTRDRALLHRSRRRACGGDQYATGWPVAQRAAARPGSWRRSVHQGRGVLLPEPRRVCRTAAGNLRQHGAERGPRSELPSDGLLLREAVRDRRPQQRGVQAGSVQHVQHGELLEPRRDVERRDSGESGPGEHSPTRARRTARQQRDRRSVA